MQCVCLQVYMFIHTDHSVATIILTEPEIKASPQIPHLLYEVRGDGGREGQERERSTRRDWARGCCIHIYTYPCVCIHTALCIYTHLYQYRDRCSLILNSSERRISILTASTHKREHVCVCTRLCTRPPQWYSDVCVGVERGVTQCVCLRYRPFRHLQLKNKEHLGLCFWYSAPICPYCPPWLTKEIQQIFVAAQRFLCRSNWERFFLCSNHSIVRFDKSNGLRPFWV